MSLKFDENVERRYKSFNMVNYQEEKWQKIGLNPLYLTVYPRYLNLRGNVFYGGLSHYETHLYNDISKMLEIMCSTLCDGIAALSFKVYKDKLFFSEWYSVEAYEKFPHIREELKQKYNLDEEVYIPTMYEIFDNYWFNYFCNHSVKQNEVQHVLYNLTPKENLEMFYMRRLDELKIFVNPNELSCDDVRWALNYNANIYMEHKVSMKTKGVYNEETMNLINSMNETKIDIYNTLYDLACKTQDMKKSINDLFIELKKYRDNPNFSYDDDMWRKLFPHTWIDLIIQFVGFDKIESQLRKTITTSKSSIYEEFFNYLIMDYDIVQLPKLMFEEDTQTFRWIYPNEFVNTGINRECENDIKLIKKYVPYKDRNKYFK